MIRRKTSSNEPEADANQKIQVILRYARNLTFDVLPERKKMMTTFKPIAFDDYIQKHLTANPGDNRTETVKNLKAALNRKGDRQIIPLQKMSSGLNALR
jgi:hypothetical protein